MLRLFQGRLSIYLIDKNFLFIGSSILSELLSVKMIRGIRYGVRISMIRKVKRKNQGHTSFLMTEGIESFKNKA